MASQARGRGRGRGPPQSTTTTTHYATIMAADRVLNKEAEYKRYVRRIHASACVLADKIAAHGDVQKSLTTGDDEGEDEAGGAGSAEREQETREVEAFLTEQRDRLKSLTVQNAKRQREVETFLQALREVREDVRAKQAASEGGDGDVDDDQNVDEEEMDYTVVLSDRVEQVRARNERGDGDVVAEDVVDRHEFCREMRARLGEKEPKRSRRSRGSVGGGDDDEDLEIVQTQDHDPRAKLKCPLTGTWFENPLRNKVCGHTISKAGYEQMRRTRRFKCPFYGCTNTSNWAAEHLEDDLEMETKVRRYLNRVKREEELQLTQNQYSDDEDCDNGDDQKMTIIE